MRKADDNDLPMAVNPKSATLPANLRHATVQESKDSGGFFSRLKKRFRLRKGNYDIGVNTGDCDNVETVSFRKRESREVLDEDLQFSPSKQKRFSPLGHRPQRSHSDAVSPEKLRIKSNPSPKRKHSNQIENNAKTGDLQNSELKRTSSLKYETVKTNDYSVIEFEQNIKTRKLLDIGREGEIKNNCVAVDDSAVDLDDGILDEPGYECLNDVKQRIESKDFSSSSIRDRIKDLTDFHSEHFNSVTAVDTKASQDDSALNLSETNLNNSQSDALTSSSKSRDSGFESSKTQNSPDSVPVVNESLNPGSEDYDADEYEMDPGYAECADAIKEPLPFAAYSDGIGSKLSSSQSLDATVDDNEPDYAECADALKGGAVRMRISVSNERLDAKEKKSKKTKSNEHIKQSSSSELYANPQILFKKRSKALLTDRSSGEFSNRSSETDRNESFTFSSSESLHKDVKEEHIKNEAPPLPARNYSLYLENEEAAQLLPEDVKLKQADDSAFEDFGYASVDEVKKQSVELQGSSSKAPPDKNDEVKDKQDEGVGCSQNVESLKQNKFSDIPDFGYASVSDVKAEKLSNKANQESKACFKAKLHDEELGISDANVSENKEVVDLGYDSVQECLRKVESLRVQDNLQGTNLENLQTKEIRESAKNEAANLSANRDSFEIAKLKYAKSLEDEFGYSSVSNVKRQSDSLDSQAIPVHTKSTCCDNSVEIVHKSDREINGFGFGSPKACSEMTTEFEPKDNNFDKKLQLKFESLHIKDDDFDKKFTTSPVSEVVSSSFLCSTPQAANKIKDECVPFTSSRVLDEDSLEVTIHDRKGSQRVLRITEKEEPAAVVEKRKSLRMSQKTKNQSGDSENSNNIWKENCTKLGEGFSPDQIDIIGSEIEKLKLIVSSSLPIDSAEPSKRDVSIDNDFRVTSAQVNQEHTQTDTKSICKTLSTNCSIVIDSSCQDSGNESADHDPKQESVEHTNLPVRRNIQKVSYRSATDSDSEDSDSKLENLPKLVIDESVFDDSDSGESLDKNKTEFSQTISSLTEQIEKELFVSESFETISKSKTENEVLNTTIKNEIPHGLANEEETELSKTVDQKPTDVVTNLLDGNSNAPDKTISDLNEAKERANTTEDLNEPVHMTLEEVMKQGYLDVLGDNFDSNSSLESQSQKQVFGCHEKGLNDETYLKDTAVLEKELLATLRENPLGANKAETETKDLSDERLNVETHSENLHLETSCDTCLHDIEWIDDVGEEAPPRPPPPVFLSPGSSDLEKHFGEVPDCHEDQRPLSLPSSGNSDDAEQGLDHLPLVFRPGSGSNQLDTEEADSPPAIPPRVRIKKHVKRASSCYRDFMESMRQLKDVGWYWGPLVWEEAEAKLANKAEGSFLVRDSSDERYILSLSFKHQGRVHHTRIEHHRGQFSFWSQPESHGKSTIKDFIEQCVENSRNGRFLYFIRPSAPGAPPLPIHLLHPVSRFFQMRSLQHMCRFAILQMVRRDHIDDLPVPTPIKKYLQEAQYYVEYLED